MIEEIIYWDQQLIVYLNNLGSTAWDSFWFLVTDKLTWIPLYVISLYLIYKYWGVKTLGLAVLIAILLVTSTDQISHLFKDVLVQRLRPCHQPGVMEHLRLAEKCGGSYGFFSGHASNHFGVAVYLGMIFRHRIKVSLLFLLLMAGLVAYSRIYIGVHYVLDVLTGAIVGSFLGYMYYLIYSHFKNKI